LVCIWLVTWYLGEIWSKNHNQFNWGKRRRRLKNSYSEKKQQNNKTKCDNKKQLRIINIWEWSPSKTLRLLHLLCLRLFNLLRLTDPILSMIFCDISSRCSNPHQNLILRSKNLNNYLNMQTHRCSRLKWVNQLMIHLL